MTFTQNQIIVILLLLAAGFFVLSNCSLECKTKDNFNLGGECPAGTNKLCPPPIKHRSQQCKCVPDSCDNIKCADGKHCKCFEAGLNNPKWYCQCVPN